MECHKASELLKKYCLNQCGMIVLCAVTAVISAVLQSVVLPSVLGKSIQIVSSGSRDELNESLMKILMFSMLLGLLFLCGRLEAVAIKRKLDCGLQRSMFSLLREDEDYYLKNPKDLAAFFRNNIPDFCEKTVEYFIRTANIFSVLIIGSVYSFQLSPVLYGICILTTLILMVCMRKKVSVVSQKQKEYMLASQEVDKKSWEHVNHHEIEAFFNHDKLIRGYRRTNDIFLMKLFELKKSGNTFLMVTLFASFILMLGISGIGGLFVLSGTIQKSALYSLLFVLPNVSKQIFGLPEIISQFGALRGLAETMDKRLSIRKGKRDGHITGTIKIIEIKKVSFGYEKEKQMFSNVSCVMKSGEFWAITGEAGCGKSTFIKLLAQLLPLQAGSIKAGAYEINTIPRKEWWDKISYLDQRPRLADGTILDNIVMGEEVNTEKVRRAVMEAGIENLIDRQPQGLYTPINVLSSGEKQKICFARIFYRDRKIVFLDEATSALDTEAEKFICETLMKKAKEGWLIAGISHRDLFTDYADQRLHFSNKEAQAG